MRHTRGRLVHIDSLADFDRRITAGARSLSGWRIESVDLSARAEQLAQCWVAGATFLGCSFAPGQSAQIEAAGGLVLPVIPDVPVETYRSRLYTPDELYDVSPYAATLDARTYAWSQQAKESQAVLAQVLHDHAVDGALDAWRSGRTVVGVMGGHALQRDSTAYAEAALLGWSLGRSRTVATGGGPGAMEAANLGAWLSRHPVDDVTSALGLLAPVPAYRPSIGAWAHTAFSARERFPEGVESLGIPTWHYGHEPPNVFAAAIAKYFRNATRESILLEVCDSGIVFLPGAAGTLQEIFQDACENYYADESAVAPMVLVGREHWTETLPAWPLLQSLARGRAMEPHVHLVDTVEEAAALVVG